MGDPITVSIVIPESVALKIIDDIMANFPEASMSLCVDNWNYEAREFSGRDTETSDDSTESGCCEFKINQADLLKGFKLMFEPGKWPKGLAFPPACAEYDGKSGPWDRWLNQADATDHDAFLQLAVLGEVIYG